VLTLTNAATFGFATLAPQQEKESHHHQSTLTHYSPLLILFVNSAGYLSLSGVPITSRHYYLD
jgi:hypothetical protein